MWFPVNKTVDWLNTSLIDLYSDDVDSALVEWTHWIQGLWLPDLSLFYVTIPLTLSQLACSSPLLLQLSFVPFMSALCHSNHSLIERETIKDSRKELKIDWHIREALSNWIKKWKNTEHCRWLERYGDCSQWFALTTAGFVSVALNQGWFCPPGDV